MRRRAIPSTGEFLPVIGCGTWQGFDVPADAASRAPLADVLRALIDAGGSVIDSSPMYGRAETVAGAIVDDLGVREQIFIATKVRTHGARAGIEEMERSFRLFRTDVIDLMQIHSLVDWRAHLPTLGDWKREGRIRYIGITHHAESAHADLEAVMRSEAVDFVQVNYSVDERGAAARLLPLAADRGIAVLANRPFGGGSRVRALGPRPLPAWATEIDAHSWSELLLRFVLAQPAVTCAIPGTGSAAHMADNVRAGQADPLDAAQQKALLTEIAG